ncbi:hypothetical protein [Amycolatopsis orientalis]|uniref:hypothetical protein n=1 Tax=Amycolatopsis orientalis TaxID=31958 RepID=UPI00055AC93A|nr:hypothetical protein [Amycolatopsis orientalis]
MSVDPAPQSRQRWLIPVLVVVLSITVAGGLLARELYRRPDSPRAAGGEATAPSATTSGGSAGKSGEVEVGVTPDAENHPQDDAVRSVLKAYFTALNKKDYDAWTETVSDARRSKQPESDWHRNFQSTKDVDILLYRIEPGAQGTLRALVGFTSTQSLNEAPVDFQEPCIRWRLVLPMKYEHGSYRIDTVDSTATERDKC